MLVLYRPEKKDWIEKPGPKERVILDNTSSRPIFFRHHPYERGLRVAT